MFRRRERISLQQRKRLNKKRQRRGILFLVLEFLILAVLVLAAFMMYKLDHLNHNTLDESSLELHESTEGIHECGIVRVGFQRRRAKWRREK